MEDPPRASSVMQMRPSTFQSRATKFFQKVSTFGRSHKVKPGQYNSPYSRSMMGAKPYMSQPALAIQPANPMEIDGSSQSDDDTPPRSIARSVKNSTPRGREPQPKHSNHRPSLSTGIVLGTHRAVIIGARPVEGLPALSSPSPHVLLPRPSRGLSAEARDDVIAIDREHSITPVAAKLNPPLPSGAAMPQPPRGGSIADRPHTLPRITVSASLPAPTSASMGPPRLPSLRISGLPSSLNRISVDGSLRLTPSLVTRHPLPILNLPTLPPPSPSVTSQRLRLRASLRAMPALPLQGSDDPEPEADHENSVLEDTDDEDDADTEPEETAMGTGSDDDGDLSESGSRSSDPVITSANLPAIDIPRIDLSFLDHSHEPSRGARAREEDATPTTTSHRDYFCANPNRNGSLSRSPARSPHPDNSNYSPARTPHPDDRRLSRLITGQPNFARVVPMPSTPSGSRPGLYQHVSRSMVDILSISKRESIAAATAVIESEVERRESIVKSKARARESINLSEPVNEEPSARQKRISEAPAYESLSNVLRRRRSMPTFNPATLPPPYPSFAPHAMRQNFNIQPRDDEGRERLPPYTNSIYLSAIMPRKLEFSSPGVQAKDRKWHRVFCVLEGTSFRVYKCSRAVGVGILGQWWEKKVGVGDASIPGPNSGIRVVVPKKPAERPAKLELHTDESSVEQGSSSEAPPSPTTRASKRLGSRLLPGGSSNRLHSRSRSDLSAAQPSHTSPRPSLNIPRPIQPGSSTTSLSINVPSSASSQVSSAASSSRSHFRSSSSQVLMDVPLVEPPMSDIIRSYTLQNAECGLGNDYLKRQHVIRVRLEGEQFLLQATDVGAVVDWIEGIQAATNIALDLDERPMPKGPSFPRRRRRRTPATGRPPDDRSTVNARH